MADHKIQNWIWLRSTNREASAIGRNEQGKYNNIQHPYDMRFQAAASARSGLRPKRWPARAETPPAAS